MDKLTAAQRRFGMQLVVQAPTDREMNPGPAKPFMDIDRAAAFQHTNLLYAEMRKELEGCVVDATGVDDLHPKLLRRFTDDQIHSLFRGPEGTVRVQIENRELQRLLDEKDAEIDRLLEPTKWWRMLGWVIMTGTVLGVIAGVYEVIT